MAICRCTGNHRFASAPVVLVVGIRRAWKDALFVVNPDDIAVVQRAGVGLVRRLGDGANACSPRQALESASLQSSSSRQIPSAFCTGRSEKEKSTVSSCASCETSCQEGTTNKSFGPQSKTSLPIFDRPRPSTTLNTVPSVDQIGEHTSELQHPQLSRMPSS